MRWVEEFKPAGRSMGMVKKRVFISYDYTNDKSYKDLVLAWNKNANLDFSFYDMPVEVSVDSSDAAGIKRDISARISDSSHFLCLVGKYTHKSRWVDWEIKKAVELKKKIVAVQVEKNTTTPNALYGVGTSWALSFNFDVIKNALG
jgi:Thoeris protein ThsB, TIR-like domain